MKARYGRTGRSRRRRAWKAAGVTLLGLVGGSLGCQGTAGQSAPRSVIEPPTAAVRWLSTPPTQADDAGTSDKCAEGSETSAANTEGQAAQATDRIIVPTPCADAPAAAGSDLVLTGARFPDGQPGADKQAVPRLVPVPAQGPAEDGADQKGDTRQKGQSGDYQVDRSLPSPVAGMDTPVIPAPEKVMPLTLGASLALAGVENPIIGLAEQAVRTSLAEQLQARVLLLPSVNVGVNYHLHNGPLQSSFGAIRKVDSQLVNYGLGTYAITAGTQEIPGLLISTHLGNAIYAPLIARQVVASRRAEAQGTTNQVLLDVSRAYLTLMGAEGRLAVLRQSLADYAEVVRLTANYAKPGIGLGRQGDADRARADYLSLQYQEKSAQQEVAVASADLAQYLNLDPSTRLQTGDVPIQVIEFVDPSLPLPKLLEIAVNNRPELRAAAATIAASSIRVSQEKTRPFFPLLIMGFSADEFGGGAVASTSGNVPNPHSGGIFPPSPGPETGGQTIPKFGRIAPRTDVDVLAVWQLQNFGFGNLARIKGRRAELMEAQAARVLVYNTVAKEVTQAYSESASRLREVEVARRNVIVSSDGFQRDLDRIRGGQGLPIEVLNNARLLALARQALLKAIIDFDRSQFELFVALGQPPTLALEGDGSAPGSIPAPPPGG
jgi:outer membrane protein TolC